MENPHDALAPNDPVDKIHAFARDLAYGAVRKMWTNYDVNNASMKLLISKKYGGDYPPHSVLYGLGYVALDPMRYANDPAYILTEKAYALLSKPAQSPSVFIAYGTQESSAFGLAIEYRLNSLDIPVFIDRSIPAGSPWNDHLRETMKQSKVVVCLLAPDTLKRSDYICEEIEFARKIGCRFISIQHSGFKTTEHCYDRSPELKAFIKDMQAIRVPGETAKDYHNAVEELVNQLGYPPIHP